MGVRYSNHIAAFMAAVTLILTGCSSLPRNPVPIDRVLEAEVAGMPSIRSWGGAFQPTVSGRYRSIGARRA